MFPLPGELRSELALRLDTASEGHFRATSLIFGASRLLREAGPFQRSSRSRRNFRSMQPPRCSLQDLICYDRVVCESMQHSLRCGVGCLRRCICQRTESPNDSCMFPPAILVRFEPLPPCSARPQVVEHALLSGSSVKLAGAFRSCLATSSTFQGATSNSRVTFLHCAVDCKVAASKRMLQVHFEIVD